MKRPTGQLKPVNQTARAKQEIRPRNPPEEKRLRSRDAFLNRNGNLLANCQYPPAYSEVCSAACRKPRRTSYNAR